MAVSSGLASGLGTGLFVWLLAGLGGGLGVGITAGLGIGIATGVRYGGRACLQHLVLRLGLQYYNCMPRHYADFLDYAAERLFLRRVGGGYIFIHRLLQKYFATMYQSDRVDSSPGAPPTAP
jgi:hypothetical protein